MPQPDRTELTPALGAVHNPDDPRHFMHIRPVARHVRVFAAGSLLAETDAAVRVLELGRDFYDPVLYVPEVDLTTQSLTRGAARSTYCPIKGDAVYFDLLDSAGGVVQEAIAWAYPHPVTGAEELARRIAFDDRYVTIEQSPA